MEAEELLKKRFRELAEKSYQNNQFTFTSFLSPADMACFYELEKELSYIPYKAWGGSEECERVILRFGSEEEFGYKTEFPIVCIQIKPMAAKFADALTHRDFLGALMNLGIERSTLGDIFLINNEGYLFCLDSMADFILDNLSKVKHTSVLCKKVEKLPDFAGHDKREVKIQIASGRIDAVAAKVCGFSRGEALELFRQKKVFVNGRLCENNSRLLAEGDTVSVRGHGKFEYLREAGTSKKGKINAVIIRYGK
ncbi:MAG: YlmH/Sll1252 family protein [Clostridium sp.]|nr:YlmH/Sll1252 family protein [Clostridium sp.]